MLRKFFRFLAIVALSFTLFLLPIFTAFAVLYEKHESGESASINYVMTTYYFAETFTATSDHSVSSIEVKLGGDYTSGEKTIVASLTETSGGAPDFTTGILAQGTVGLSTLTYLNSHWDNDWTTFTFSGSVDITNGTKYAIVLSCSTCVVGDRPYVMTDSNTSDQYAGGDNYRSSNSGSTWPTSYPNDDMLFRINGTSAATITTDNITQNGYIEGLQFGVTLSATVTDDGGGANATIPIAFWRDYTENSSIWNMNGSATPPYFFSTGDIFEIDMNYLIGGHTYEYYVQSYNGYATANTSTANFTVSESGQAPHIVTRQEYNTGNPSTGQYFLNGQVVYDGGDNVTGGFAWREYGTDNWSYTDNWSDLESLDLYTENISISINTLYEYMAQGSNAYGSDNSSITQFTLTDVSQPSVETLSAANVTATDAVLRGQVLDMGNDPLLDVWFQIKEENAIDWIELPNFQVESTGIFTFDTALILSGLLQPDTTYEYQAVAEAHVILGDEIGDTGEIRTFRTLETNVPPVILTGAPVYAGHSSFVLLNGNVNFDGGATVTGWFEYRKEGDLSFYEYPLKDYGLVTGDNFTTMVHVLPDIWYGFKACGSNSYGSDCGDERLFRIVDDSLETPSTGDSDQDVIISINELIDDIKEQLGLTGIMGTWAFMGLILLIIALIFGTVFFAVWQKNQTAATGVGVVWALLSIAVVGAFVFSEELGIWPIVILASATVVLIFIIAGKLLGGGE